MTKDAITVTQADIDCRNAIYKELTGLRVDDDIAAQPDWMDKYLARHRTTSLAAQDGCPSCHGLNISCPEGCGRDPVTG